jgi:O-antigen/teichoic acid export membrane protein
MIGKFLTFIFGNKIDQNLKNKFLKGSFSSILLQISLSLLTLLTSIAVARITGEKGFGIYTLVFTWVGIFSSAALLGLDDLALRQMAIYKSNNSNKEAKAFIILGLRFSLFSSLTFAILYLLFSIFFYLPGVAEFQSLHVIAAISIPFFVIITYFQSVLKGWGFIFEGQVADKLIQPLGFISILFIYFFSGFNVTDQEAVIFRVISFVFAAVIIVIIIFSKLKRIFSAEKVSINFFKWKHSLFYFTLSTVLYVINSRIDIVFLGLFSIEPEKIAYYNVALKFSDIALIPFLVICSVATPLFASMYHEGKKVELQKFYTLITRISFVIILCIISIFISFGPWFLNWYGKNFQSGYDVLVLLCFSKLVHVFVGPANYLLSMSGFEKYVTRALILSVVVTISLHMLLIPSYGISGSAWATLIGLLFYDLYIAYIGFKKTGLFLSVIGNFYNRKK